MSRAYKLTKINFKDERYEAFVEGIPSLFQRSCPYCTHFFPHHLAQARYSLYPALCIPPTEINVEAVFP